MLILTKSILAIGIGFTLSVILGVLLIPLLKRMNIGQRISIFVGDTHKKKEGTPTMGGIIFILSTLITTLILLISKKIDYTTNLGIVLLVFTSFGLIGFLDDFLSIKRGNNEGLTEVQKLLAQVVVSLIFFFMYMKNGGQTALIVSTLNINIQMGWIYGLFILFLLVGSSNAVNLTDGLDGLAGGLAAIAFIAFGLISMTVGFHDMGIFTFILVGSLFGFLLFNAYPAKVFMGDTGSLALGGVMATIAVLTHREITLAVVAGVFIIETLTVIIQVISVKFFHKKVFLMTPIHHHFEKLGWSESDIVRLFYTFGLILAMAGIVFGVWL